MHAAPALPALSLLLTLAPAPEPVPVVQPTPATTARAIVIEAGSGAALDENALYAKLAAHEIVYVGEQHDKPLHHRIQAAVVAAVASSRPGTVVGFEMLSLDQQPTLDNYMAGSISEADFEKFWNKHWGYAFSMYKPIFDAIRTHGAKAVALNAPRAIVKQIARGGISSLTPAQRSQLPATINPISDPDYLKYVNDALDGHGPMPPDMRRRMIEAQTAWNETMAETLQTARANGPAVVIAGSGHMIFNAGIAESIRYRSTASQTVVLPYPLDGERLPAKELMKRLRDPARDDKRFGSFFWLLPG